MTSIVLYNKMCVHFCLAKTDV